MYQQFNPYGFQQPQLQPQQQQIPKVHGREGANAYTLAANSSVLLMDESEPIVWMVMTDAAGYKTVTPFDVKQHEEPKPVTQSDFQSFEDTMNSFDARIKKLEESINGKSNGSYSATNDATVVVK